MLVRPVCCRAGRDRCPGQRRPVGTFVAFGVFVFIAQYLQLVIGLSPLNAGLWTMPFAAAFVGSMLTPVLIRSIRPAFVMAGGLGISAIGFAMLALLDAASGPGFPAAAFVV
jgi:MFS transporter, DHA2 family, multidrug resistance protein